MRLFREISSADQEIGRAFEKHEKPLVWVFEPGRQDILGWLVEVNLALTIRHGKRVVRAEAIVVRSCYDGTTSTITIAGADSVTVAMIPEPERNGFGMFAVLYGQDPSYEHYLRHAMRLASMGEWRMLHAYQWVDAQGQAATGELKIYGESPPTGCRWVPAFPLINPAAEMFLVWRLHRAAAIEGGAGATDTVCATDRHGNLIKKKSTPGVSPSQSAGGANAA